MLLVHFSLAPAKSIQKLKSTDGAFSSLQIVENTLAAKGDGLEIVNICGHVIDCPAKGSYEEETLK